jgi:asparagine synthase (glutamine-hydrolysing)
MCGIWAYINLYSKSNLKPENVSKLMKGFYNLKHRGPDNSFLQMYGNNVCVGFHRLAIMSDNFGANQPIIIEHNDKIIVFICNGEIYNHEKIRSDLKINANISSSNSSKSSRSDCEVIPLLYLEYGSKKFPDLFKYTENQNGFTPYVRGEYSFVLLEFTKNKNLKRVIAGRDSIGVRPLYYNVPSNVSEPIMFSSEIKGFEGSDCNNIHEFPPGQIHYYNCDEFNKVTIQKYNFYDVNNIKNTVCDSLDSITETQLLKLVYNSAIDSIRCRLDADKPIAFLLSGGVDSSLVAAISAKILKKPIRTFCCGMNKGTDLEYASKVAKWIGSDHTEVIFTPEEGLTAIDDVIRTTETWDTTTIRASVVQYLVSKHIGQKTDCKVVMVGEGVDECCSSYLFNWYAPSGDDLHNCAKEYITNIHLYDGRRSDRCVSRWGLETRVPFLDPMFIENYWKIPSEWRMPTYKGIEKWWLRKAFEKSDVLPSEVLWRKKEAQSDGVSSKEESWFKIIQQWVEDKVTNEEMENANNMFPINTPKTKEAYYYRKVFCNLFGNNNQTILPNYWQPKWLSDGKEVKEYIDPSARILDIYNK